MAFLEEWNRRSVLLRLARRIAERHSRLHVSLPHEHQSCEHKEHESVTSIISIVNLYYYFRSHSTALVSPKVFRSGYVSCKEITCLLSSFTYISAAEICLISTPRSNSGAALLPSPISLRATTTTRSHIYSPKLFKQTHTYWIIIRGSDTIFKWFQMNHLPLNATHLILNINQLHPTS